MASSDLMTALDSIAAKAATNPLTHETRWAVRSPSRDLEWSWIEADARIPYFAASITKMVTASIVFHHIGAGAYALSTPAHTLLPRGTMDGLHTRDGVDSSREITVEHLLAHTSGIADYFEEKRADGGTLVDDMLAGDRGWSPVEALDMVRGATPSFAVGSPRKMHYSDTNYQLLQLIIEMADGMPYAESARTRVFEPLGLDDTYIFTGDTLDRYDDVATIFAGKAEMRIPQAMASFGADGGMVSTTADQLTLLQGIVHGRLFPRTMWDDATATWRRMQFPLSYGTGVMRFHLPAAMNPWKPLPEMVGHSGASGTVLYWAPELDVFVAGAVNQFEKRSLPFKTLSELARAVR